MSSNDLWHSSVHIHLAPFFFSECNGAALVEKSEMKQWYQAARPRNRCNSFMEVGVGNDLTASTLPEFTLTPSAVIV